MIKRNSKYCIILLALFGLSCTKFLFNWNDDNGSIPDDAFKYSAYDSTGVKIVEGWFTLEFKDSINVIGKWNFKKIGDAKNIGPQVGEGNLEGNLSNNTKIFINLNSGWADNNVFWDGTYTATKISGKWMWSTFVGVTNYGTFNAEK